MASLNHVCMWDEKGWKRITADEASRLHPGGTVSARSGLFMCELCGQYVLLTDGQYQRRHFRHSSAEKSKNCPERTFGVNVRYGYEPIEHDLPIRIRNISNNSFEFDIGFVKVPENLITKQLRIEIILDDYGTKSFVYLKERLNTGEITYLSVGGSPSEKYKISISGASDSIYEFWPRFVSGIDPEGTVFDAATGKKLVYDSDVVVGKKYYLLRDRPLYRINKSHISIQEVACKRISWSSWRLYEVIANDYDMESAKFFLDYHCRLTERPISIQAVWPVYIESPYIIKHNQKSVVMHISGNATATHVFPHATVKKYESSNSTVIEVFCNGRQQLISAGRTKALQYTYFWRQPLEQSTEKPKAIVSDINDKTLPDGIHNSIPEKRTLNVTVRYDGMITIKSGGILIEKRKLHANNTSVIDNITWNTEINVFIGLDNVWSASFTRKEIEKSASDEKEILLKLKSYSGVRIPVSHTLGSLASELISFPEISKWLYKCIRSGYINEKAYRELQSWILERNSKVH